MTSTAAPSKRLLPNASERVAFANILLLCGLPLLAHLVHLHGIAETMEVDFPLEVPAALLAYAVSSLGLLHLWRRCLSYASFRARVERLAAAPAASARTARAHPLATIWLSALAGVLLSCYPVVFAGKSFVSPQAVVQLLYSYSPGVPGPPRHIAVEDQGNDTGAMMWQHLPYSTIEHRAIFQDHELPVWNRYDGGGLTLIGQGQSMLGDPLNWLVVLTGGAAWAWDVKFLVVRLLFAAGIGLCVRAITRRVGAASVMALSVCFLGFFTYRFNHPAQFSLCYAPWILLAWLTLLPGEDRETAGPDAARGWASWRWAALLFLANWMEFNSGTVKESMILLLGLNSVGVLMLGMARGVSWRWKGRRLLQAAWMGMCFVLMSTPFWRTFAEALGHSWNSYQKPEAWQLQPGLLIGFFDDIFYRQFKDREQMLDPSANFVVLLGVAYALPAWRVLVRRHAAVAAVGAGSLAALAMVFGVVPSDWICATPFLAGIFHIDNTFSCVLLVLLPVLAGVGLERCRETAGTADFRCDYGTAAAVVLTLGAAFVGLTHARMHADFVPFKELGGTLETSRFLTRYAAVLFAGVLAVPLLLRWWRAAGAAAGWGVAPWMVLCAAVMLWRGGLHLPEAVGLRKYVIHPGPRYDLQASSPAVEYLRVATREQPALCMGFNLGMMGGFIATYGLESPLSSDALQNSYYHELQEGCGAPHVERWLGVGPSVMRSPVARLYDLLGVRYYGAMSLNWPDGEFPGLRTVGRFDMDLYERPQAWPRAFFTDSVVPCGTLAEFYRTLFSGDDRPFAGVLPEEIGARPDKGKFADMLRPGGKEPARTVIPASGYRLTTRTTSFHLSAPGPGLAVLGEGFQRPYNVQVYLDGQPVPHLRVNWAFMGIRVPAGGEHEVRVVYGPRDLPLLLGISGVGVFLLAGTAVQLRVKSKTAIDRKKAGEPTPAGLVPEGKSDQPIKEVLAGTAAI